MAIAAFEKSAIFETAIADASYANWKPPGELWKILEDGGQTYEIWKGSLADLAVQQMIKRIQILIPLFIEGGTLINVDDPEWVLERWTVFFLYQKNTEASSPISPYTFMGYSTVYRYFFYKAITSSSSPYANKQRIQHPATLDFELSCQNRASFSSLSCRSRISQFVILPPFQGRGNGSRFYTAIFDFYSKQPQTIEITVEDPNVDFDDLRDINDIAYLRTVPEFASLRINTKANPRSKNASSQPIMDSEVLEQLRLKVKIAPRQFSRVVEMQLLSLIPTGVRQSMIEERPNITGTELAAKKHEYYLWQLFVKTRLYKHNKVTLMQLYRAERIDKLEETLGAVEADYARLLRSVDKKNSWALVEKNGNGTSTHGNESAKRSSPTDAAGEGGEQSAKRVKFAEA